MIWPGKSDELISLVVLRDIFMYELSTIDFMLKNENRRVCKFLNKSRKLRGGWYYSILFPTGFMYEF